MVIQARGTDLITCSSSCTTMLARPDLNRNYRVADSTARGDAAGIELPLKLGAYNFVPFATRVVLTGSRGFSALWRWFGGGVRASTISAACMIPSSRAFDIHRIRHIIAGGRGVARQQCSQR